MDFSAKEKNKDEEFTCYFCKKSGHMKKECHKQTAWRVKEGKFLTLVYSEVNLAFVPKDTWWVELFMNVFVGDLILPKMMKM